tara:strand:- start:3871 stop:4347 length:477 start_codon:yes stop_codon:yes gene_type:complete
MHEVYMRKFRWQYEDACAEHRRLNNMFKDVMWYNFETHCRSWGTPWPTSQPESVVRMRSQRHRRFFNRNRLLECTDVDWWYRGPVCTAPHLPPEVVLVELRLAKAEVRRCEEQLTAAEDWAPGGLLYKELARKYRKRSQEAAQISCSLVDKNERRRAE